MKTKKKNKAFLTLLTITCLSGCAESVIFNKFKQVAPVEEDAVVYLGAEMELEVGEGNIATVYGYDQCPSSMFLDSGRDGCVKLEGEFVSVILRNGEKLWTESWTLEVVSDQYILTTPEGFKVRQPKKMVNKES
ncbi:hypothetical protein [Vibrio crassostreae]|uniref:hypothetical protein n=1 Tax=Vibrio crassostreae TaxID=246167 RepID=UPI001B3170AA|nr:hypothetical protein [Vibrio crassostreae]